MRGWQTWWQQYRQWCAKRLLATHPEVTLQALRRDPLLATEVLARMYEGDAAFVARVQELEAAGRLPQRTSFAYPALPTAGGVGHGLQRTLPKVTPWSLRRFGELPPTRRAINAIKLPILDLPFTVGLRAPIGAQCFDADPVPTADQHRRIKAATLMFLEPNAEVSGREFLEVLLDDLLTVGAGAFEAQPNRSDERPLFLWTLDAQSIRLNLQWRPGSREARYSQARGGFLAATGSTDDVWLDDTELCYLKINVRSHTPFGLGYLEIAFNTVNAYLGAFEYAERRASNTTPNYLIFLGENVPPETVQRFRHYWENDIEGYGKVPIMGGGRSPSVQAFTQDTGDALYLRWQEWLTRVIFMAFGLSPMQAGLERDVNRSTAEVQQTQDWASIAPIANTVRQAWNRWVLWERLGWRDLTFSWTVRTTDELRQAEILAEQWHADAIYVDELRAIYERPPLPEGRGQMTKTAYEAAVKAAASASQYAGALGARPAEAGETASTVTPLHETDMDQLSPGEQVLLRQLLKQGPRHRRARRNGAPA